MRRVLAAAALGALCAVAAAVLLTGDESPRPVAAPAPALPSPALPSPALPSPALPAPAEPEHEDDYAAPWYELIDHIDHLDRTRIPPDTLRAIDEELERRGEVADRLWSAYAPVLGGEPDVVPPAVDALDAGELAYVLLSARAEQLATTTARTGSLDTAVEQTLPDADDVTVVLDGGCVAVSWAADPLGRAFGAQVAPPSAGPLVERLERAVRVAAAGEPACAGQAVAYSPGALAALDG